VCSGPPAPFQFGFIGLSPPGLLCFFIEYSFSCFCAVRPPKLCSLCALRPLLFFLCPSMVFLCLPFSRGFFLPGLFLHPERYPLRSPGTRVSRLAPLPRELAVSGPVMGRTFFASSLSGHLAPSRPRFAPFVLSLDRYRLTSNNSVSVRKRPS